MSKRTVIAVLSSVLLACGTAQAPAPAAASKCTSDVAIVATDNGRIECPPGTTMQVRPARSEEHAFVFVFCDCPNAAAPSSRQPSPASRPREAVPADTSM